MQDELEQINKKSVCKSINPDEAVAYGAAVQAALLSEDIKNVPKLMLLDVTPLSLGWGLLRDEMSVVIPRNTTIPIKMTKDYVTVHGNQSIVMIQVYEGERTRASDNNLLGSFRLAGLPPAPRGHPFHVCFAIDENGILTVSAEEKTTGNKNDITITNEKGRLSTEEIYRLIQEAEYYQAEDKKFLSKVNAMNALDKYTYKMKNSMKNSIINIPMDEQKVSAAIREAENLLDDNQQAEANVFENCLHKVKTIYEPIIVKRKQGRIDEAIVLDD